MDFFKRNHLHILFFLYSFCFVEYGHVDAAKKAKNETDGIKIDGKVIEVVYGKQRRDADWGEKEPTTTLLVRNLPYETKPYILQEAFEGCIAVRMPRFSKTGKYRG